jgi:hypothetical protein
MNAKDRIRRTVEPDPGHPPTRCRHTGRLGRVAASGGRRPGAGGQAVRWNSSVNLFVSWFIRLFVML